MRLELWDVVHLRICAENTTEGMRMAFECPALGCTYAANTFIVRKHRVDLQCVNAEASHCRVDFLLPRSDGTIFFIELD